MPDGFRGFSRPPVERILGVSLSGNVVYQYVDYEVAILIVSDVLDVYQGDYFDVLIVGGGGGSGGGNSTYVAGGGAGEVIYRSKFYIPGGCHPVIIGNGGAANTGTGNGGTGTDTKLSNLLLARGGGGAYLTSHGGNCGDGVHLGGARNSGAGGGGAGAGSNGQDAPTTSQGGNGGEGVTYDITGVSLQYGPGGGGNAVTTQGVGGTGYFRANTGAGGSNWGGAGKAGIVVVRRNLITPRP